MSIHFPAPMTPELDQSVFDWIRTGRDETRWPAPVVSNLVPPIFESYAKLLHSIHPHYEFIDHPLSEPERAILKIPSCEPLRSFVEDRRLDSAGARIRWKQLAELLDVPFARRSNTSGIVKSSKIRGVGPGSS